MSRKTRHWNGLSWHRFQCFVFNACWGGGWIKKTSNSSSASLMMRIGPECVHAVDHWQQGGSCAFPLHRRLFCWIWITLSQPSGNLGKE